jgi:hypothetical protein
MGVLAGVAVVLLILLIMKLMGKEGSRFDERQVAARGVAYKWGFFTLMIYEAAYAVLNAMNIRFADETMGPVIGIFLGVAVFGSIAAAKDAYVAVNEKPGAAWIWGLVGVLWTAVGVMKLTSGEGIENGILTTDSMQIFMGGAFLTVGVTYLIRRMTARRDGEGEE